MNSTDTFAQETVAPVFVKGQQFLPQSDVDAHTRLGISPDILTRAQVRRVDDREARDVLGKSHSKPGYFDGVEYPYLDPKTGRRVTSSIRLNQPSLKPDGRHNKGRATLRR